jgi:biopolymer transport protein ExbB
MDNSQLVAILGNIIYVCLMLIAFWGAFCVVVVWRRVAAARFRNEKQQIEFLDKVDKQLAGGDYKAIEGLCEGDSRAIPQLIHLAVANRRLEPGKVRRVIGDRFQRDILGDMEHRLSWVYTVIKTAPMLGLLGTVLGMIGAFGQLASNEKVEASALADDISVALYTTAFGLAVAIPLVICTASINVRIRKMEDFVGEGLSRFFESFKIAISQPSSREK